MNTLVVSSIIGIILNSMLCAYICSIFRKNANDAWLGIFMGEFGLIIALALAVKEIQENQMVINDKIDAILQKRG